MGRGRLGGDEVREASGQGLTGTVRSWASPLSKRGATEAVSKQRSSLLLRKNMELLDQEYTVVATAKVGDRLVAQTHMVAVEVGQIQNVFRT